MLRVNNLNGFGSGAGGNIMDAITWQSLYATKIARTAYITNKCFQTSNGGNNADVGFVNGVADWATAKSAGAGYWNANTGKVRTWYDQSGNANDLFQSVNANKPTGDGVNFLIDFPGGSEYMTTGGGWSQPWYLFLSAKLNVSSDSKCVWFGGPNSSFNKGTNGTALSLTHGGTSSTVSAPGSTWQQFTALFAPTASSPFIGQDGVHTGVTLTGSGTLINDFRLANSAASDFAAFSIDFCGVTTDVLTSSDIAAIESYITANYNA